MSVAGGDRALAASGIAFPASVGTHSTHWERVTSDGSARHALWMRDNAHEPLYQTQTTAAGQSPPVRYWYTTVMPKATITLTYDEALYIADLLAVASDSTSNDEHLPDTFPAEARLAINLILSRTDD